jgi:hypothetical protein
MPAKPPSQLEIGGRIIAIRIDPELEDWGQYRSDDREIVLSSRALEKQSTMRETLRHELLHAALDISGLSYLERYEEESVVRCIENIFHPAWDKLRAAITIIE